MPTNISAESVKIYVNGTQLTNIANNLVEVVVDTNTYLPTMFTITLDDGIEGTYINSDTPFKLGAKVKIEFVNEEIPGTTSAVTSAVVIGEVTALEPIFNEQNNCALRVRGYDYLHRLTQGKKTLTFGDASPTSQTLSETDIVSKIISSAGLTSQVDSINVKYSYVMQYNQTDLEFLWSRARLYGYQIYAIDKTVYFKPADFHRGAASETPSELIWGTNLSRFEPRVTLIGALTKAIARGWDPGTKTALVAENSSDTSGTIPSIGFGKKGSSESKTAVNNAGLETILDLSLINVDQATAIAKAQFAEAESEFIKADGVLRIGDPRLVAGRKVTIKGVGTRFNGTYYVSEARHVWRQGAYTVFFSVNGRNPYTVADLLRSDQAPEGYQKLFGVVVGLVTNVDDPEKLGRVQVKFPWMPPANGAEFSSNWARIVTPMGGSLRGFYYLPEVNDEVLVAFDHGDIEFPYIVGALWNKKDKPPVGTADIIGSDKKINQRIICSRSGHLIILDDTADKEQIIVMDKSKKNSIVIDTKNNTITVKSESVILIESNDTLSIKSKGDMVIDAGGKLTIKAANDMVIQSAQGKISAKSMGDMALESSTGKGSFKGTSGMTIESTASTAVKGLSVEVNGSGTAALKSSGVTQIKGSLVQIN
ncbi:MAG TPA: VgrG-related protein [Anaerolineaceae bacterium]|nr:VgrG-related protein [Anaerolineaceae bacterium]HPN52373.1 VgrG-related protein [Anaerolineaceae bacterium]